ncbi:eukaryotic translation initiation factor 2-alpha kinase eif2-alpha kinase -related [Anaeramoeba flamelloides]|uniref:Eukaryotic translation initiation factor 2-alpha kinase eif2-alpha kinase -related n=1 Tax=Anaeramoeba flamelloides TaxID=1746091 RepID=A0AAV7YVT6_9EUKA|nr:eukaryotic translation initiation factor 2-alpha kinase eif2-alpha kinase -related [Anaeramoeba flamelloides]
MSQNTFFMSLLEGDEGKVKKLIAEGLDVNYKNEYLSTPLHLSCRESQYRIGKLLIENGCEIDPRDENGTTPLHTACDCACFDLVDLLLKKGADVNAVDFCDQTPLYLACCSSSLDSCELLIAKGADINTKCGEEMETCLHLSSFLNNKKLVNLLLKHGADPLILNGESQKASELSVDEELQKRLSQYESIFVDYSPSLIVHCRDKTETVIRESKHLLIDPNSLKTSSLLGEGTYSKVFQGWLHTKEVAIKILKKNTRGHSLRLFQREVATLCNCNHKNVVNIIGFYMQNEDEEEERIKQDKGKENKESEIQKETDQKNENENENENGNEYDNDNGNDNNNDNENENDEKNDLNSTSCIVLEYCSGGTLDQILKKNRKMKKKLSKEKILFYAKQIASGMKFLHSKGIVHRDLKPSNLLITEGDLIKITDFGLSKFHETPQMAGDKIIIDPMTLCVGNWVYIAPEMTNNGSNPEICSFPIDVYSYGLLLWSIAMSEVPTQLRTLAHSDRELRELHPRMPSSSECYPEIIDLIYNCAHRYPENRPTFAKICDLLDNVKI